MLLFWDGVLVALGSFIVIGPLVESESNPSSGLGIIGVSLLKCAYKVISFAGIFIVLKSHFVPPTSASYQPSKVNPVLDGDVGSGISAS